MCAGTIVPTCSFTVHWTVIVLIVISCVLLLHTGALKFSVRLHGGETCVRAVSGFRLVFIMHNDFYKINDERCHKIELQWLQCRCKFSRSGVGKTFEYFWVPCVCAHNVFVEGILEKTASTSALFLKYFCRFTTSYCLQWLSLSSTVLFDRHDFSAQKVFLPLAIQISMQVRFIETLSYCIFCA